MAPFQNRPVNASSAVAVVLLTIPRDLIWLKASLYASLASAGGGLGRKIRRCRLVISRSRPENIRNRLGVRAVVAAQGEDALRDCLSYMDPFRLVVAIWNLCQRLL